MREQLVSLPVEVLFLSDPAGVPLPSDKQQIEQPYEAEHQAHEEQLSEGRYQEAREGLGRQAEMPRRWEKARNADPVKRQKEQSKSQKGDMSVPRKNMNLHR